MSKHICGFISHRCRDYDNKPYREPIESYLVSKGIEPVFGCFLESSSKGILEKNIEEGIKKSHLFIPIVTPSWIGDQKYIGEPTPPYWPSREWEIWLEEKRGTKSYDCCIGFSIYPAQTSIYAPKGVFRPLHIKNIITFPLMDEPDERYNTLLYESTVRKLYINEKEKKQAEELIARYIALFI